MSEPKKRGRPPKPKTPESYTVTPINGKHIVRHHGNAVYVAESAEKAAEYIDKTK